MRFHFTDAQILRFWARVDTGDHWGCWPWMGGRAPGGYGQITLAGQRRHAHRLAYELIYGAIPDGLVISHLCNTPACCNPSHLRATSQSDNLFYMYECGRGPNGDSHYSRQRPELLSRGDAHYSRRRPERLARGQRNGWSKLTDEKVREIRRLHADGLSQMEIERRLGIDHTTISLVVRRKRWAHVTDPPGG